MIGSDEHPRDYYVWVERDDGTRGPTIASRNADAQTEGTRARFLPFGIGGGKTIGPPSPYWWLMLAPLLTGIGYLALILVAGRDVLVTDQPGLAGTIAGGLLTAFFTICLAGTITLYNDAVRIAASTVPWTPNPWSYIAGGAVVLVVVRVLQLGLLFAIDPALVPALLGMYVVALVLSSLVAGPVFLVQRYRHLGPR